MGKIFDIDGKFMSVLNKVADLMILNVIWIICCIPVFTIGAATSALYYVTLKMVKNEDAYIVKSFFKSFKQNFKQGTLIWLIMLAIGILLSVDLYITLQMQSTITKILVPCIGAIMLIYLFILLYIFPLLARFDNTIFHLLKNSLLMGIRHLPWTILNAVLIVGPVFIGLNFLQLIPVWIIIGYAGLAYISSFIFVRIFKNYEPNDEEELETEVSEEAQSFDEPHVGE